MSSLTSKAVDDTYKDLLQVSNSNSGVDATLRNVEDGEGTASAVAVSTTAFGVKDQSGAGSYYTSLVFPSTYTANRNLSFTLGDAARGVTLSGDLSIAGDFTTSGAYATTLTSTAATNVTLPTTGTLSTLAGTETLTNKKLDDATVTIVDTADATKQLAFQASGITTATTRTVTAQDASGTMYITGGTDVSLADGGTNASLTASNGGVFYSTATAGAILEGTATANQLLTSGSSAAPAWTTATYPATTTVSQLLYSSSANTVAGLATANSGVLVTSEAGVPSIATDIPTAVTIGGQYVYRVAGTDVPIADGGTGDSTASGARVNLGAAASGANLDITSVYLNNTGLKIKDSNSTHGLTITTGSDLSANRNLTFNPGDAARIVTINADTTLSGTNTGDQTITLTGDVTGTGTGSFTATIANDAVSYAKIQNVSATDKVLGRSTAGAGDVEEIACTAAARTILDDTTVDAIIDTLGGAAATGTGGIVRATSPALATPSLGVASAITVNKVTITAPATASTLTIVDGGSLITAGAYATTLTSTAATNVTLPTTGTLATLAGAEALTEKTQIAVDNLDLNGNTISTTNANGNLILSPNGTGQITAPAQAAFEVYLASDALNVTGDGTVYTVLFDTERQDIGNNYATGTGIFTAPVSGFYIFSYSLQVQGLGAAHNDASSRLVTSVTTYSFNFDPQGIDISGAVVLPASLVVYLAATQTAKIDIVVSGSTLTADIGGPVSMFSGRFLG